MRNTTKFALAAQPCFLLAIANGFLALDIPFGIICAVLGAGFTCLALQVYTMRDVD
jgi:hypothetical protein